MIMERASPDNGLLYRYNHMSLPLFLPYAHEAIPRGYSEQTVLKVGMFEDLCLANKQLRFVLIFLMVCLLLNRREIVRQLLNQLKVLIDKCKRTFQPWVTKRETVIGKKNCHQILTKVGLSYLFVPRILRTISDAPPTHYAVKVQSISLLTKHNLEKYESGDFEAGGYKWKLVFYPNGNKNRNVKEHISLYLVMSGATAPKISSEVYAVFRLFILDQNNGNYLVLQDPKERRFHGMKLDWGFDQFLSHKAFIETSNGFLIDDTCVLGAEVFVSKETSKGKGERLSMVKDPVMCKSTWRIDNVSKLDAESCDSEAFTAGDQKWKMQLYPKGKDYGVGTLLAIYLALAEPKSLPPGCQIYAGFKLRILDQLNARHWYGEANHWFSASNSVRGWTGFGSLEYFNRANRGLVLKDTCIVEAEVTVHGITETVAK